MTAKIYKLRQQGNDFFVEYQNIRVDNGNGRERIWFDDGRFFISSDWGTGFGERIAHNKRGILIFIDDPRLDLPTEIIKLVSGAEETSYAPSGLGIHTGERIDL